jgi:hypothetical protein
VYCEKANRECFPLEVVTSFAETVFIERSTTQSQVVERSHGAVEDVANEDIARAQGYCREDSECGFVSLNAIRFIVEKAEKRT